MDLIAFYKMTIEAIEAELERKDKLIEETKDRIGEDSFAYHGLTDEFTELYTLCEVVKKFKRSRESVYRSR